VTDTTSKEKLQLTLTDVHQEAIKAANSSWGETDRLYVSVCSALLAVAGIGSKESGPKIPIIIIGFLSLILAICWIVLICRYRKKILYSLKVLSEVQDGPRIMEYFGEERKRFKKDWKDYLIAMVILGMSLVMIFFSSGCSWPPFAAWRALCS
jgi:hypothetical protein